jgi:S-formylglutathione hydrolase FrmB
MLASVAEAQSRIDCDAIPSHILNQSVHYCVLLPPDYSGASAKEAARRYPVLYLLHGLGQNEQTLFQSGAWDLVEDLRQEHRITDFLIVTPEAKASFYINSADGKLRYSDFFVHELLPYIEGKYRVRRAASGRGITGVSMGGYGALRFAFAYPELFSSVSAQSAALFTDSPHELDRALESGVPLGDIVAAVYGNPIDVPHWKQNDPFVLARKNRLRLRGLAIYFNCGREDQFSFEDGAAALDRQLSSEDVRHEFHLYDGDHSSRYFLAHLGEVLEFHSHAFATDE